MKTTPLCTCTRAELTSEEVNGINVGTPLGIQGNVGLSSNQTVSEHVHVEVRNGRRTFPGCGAISTIDPIDYLYRSVSGG